MEHPIGKGQAQGDSSLSPHTNEFLGMLQTSNSTRPASHYYFIFSLKDYHYAIDIPNFKASCWGEREVPSFVPGSCTLAARGGLSGYLPPANTTGWAKSTVLASFSPPKTHAPAQGKRRSQDFTLGAKQVPVSPVGNWGAMLRSPERGRGGGGGSAWPRRARALPPFQRFGVFNFFF